MSCGRKIVHERKRTPSSDFLQLIVAGIGDWVRMSIYAARTTIVAVSPVAKARRWSNWTGRQSADGTRDAAR